MLSRNNRPYLSNSEHGNSTSRVNRNIFQTSIGNYHRNRPASISSSSSSNLQSGNSFGRKCYYCLWFLLLLAVSGVTLFMFQSHLDSIHSSSSSSSSSFSSIKDLFHHLPNTENNDFLRKPGITDPQNQKAKSDLSPSLPQLPPSPPPPPPIRSEQTSSDPQKLANSKEIIVNRPPYDRSMFKEIHFVHIPKCGGTTMTAVLRQIQCYLDPITNADCCLNPGFCDWHAHRRCQCIKGCINHFPNRKLIMNSIPSFVVFREPISRILSAWFYRGHTPNNDFFQVRPEFKEIRDGKRPQVKFEEYIEMVEYQNIQTRMLGADSFPYRNITITQQVFEKALEAVDHFFFIGLQEEFDISARAFAREIVRNDSMISIVKEREQNSNRKIKEEKKAIQSNANLMAKLRLHNNFDLQLYQRAVERFCELMKRYPDLYSQIRANQRISCP